MSTFDIILIVLLALFMLAGWRSGFLKKFIALVCLALSLVLATKYAGELGDEVYGPMGVSGGLATALGFVTIVGIIMLIQAVVYHLAIRKLGEGLWNKIAGAVMGVVEGGIILSMTIIFLGIYFHLPSQETKSNSSLYLPVKNLAPQIFDGINALLPESQDFYEEIISSGKKAANLKQPQIHQ
jgi:uncharacterized membrane protein required for colicin V production